MEAVFNYVIGPLIVVWGIYVTSTLVRLDKKFSLIEKIVSIIDFDKIPKTKNFNDLIKTLEG